MRQARSLGRCLGFSRNRMACARRVRPSRQNLMGSDLPSVRHVTLAIDGHHDEDHAVVKVLLRTVGHLSALNGFRLERFPVWYLVLPASDDLARQLVCKDDSASGVRGPPGASTGPASPTNQAFLLPPLLWLRFGLRLGLGSMVERFNVLLRTGRTHRRTCSSDNALTRN